AILTGAGTATITANIEGLSATVPLSVALAPVASVTLAPTSATIVAGGTVTLVPTVRDVRGRDVVGRPMLWESLAPAVATVSPSGVVTGVTPGSATVRLTVDGVVATAPITVTAIPVASVTLAPDSLTLDAGAAATLNATTRSSTGAVLTGRAITWRSLDPTIATVTAGTGNAASVDALTAGVTRVIATSEGRADTVPVVVLPPPVASVEVSPDTLGLTVGATGQLAGTLRDANGGLLTGRTTVWTSRLPAIATVSATGLVTAAATGESWVVLTSEGKRDSALVQVSPEPVATVTIVPGSASIAIGGTVSLTAVARNAAGSPLTGRTTLWTSSNAAVATIGAGGTVTGLAAGSTTITATVEGVSATALVSVANAPVASVDITPDSGVVVVGQTLQLTGELRDAAGNVLTGRTTTWTSRTKTVATVRSTGLVTAVAPGTSWIVHSSRAFERREARQHHGAGDAGAGGDGHRDAGAGHGRGGGHGHARRRGAECATITATIDGVPGTSALTVTAPPAAQITMSVNTSSQHSVSRLIYGMNLTADNGGVYSGGSPWYGAQPPAEVTLDRFGGNRLTAYNWENNYSNAGNDYNYQNDNFLSQSTTPGEAVRTRVAAARSRGAGAIVTVPMLGYVSADGAGPTGITDAARATRLATRFRVSQPFKGAALSLVPNVSDGVVSQDEFVNWVDKTFPGAATDPSRPILFSLDNEPDIWHSTHKEIQSDSADNPNRPRLQTYDGFINTTIDYARAVKSVVPGATVLGPAVGTWTGAVTLGRWPSPDPVYASQNFFDVYLNRLKQAETTYGRRLVDALDLHWYPAAGTSAGEISNDYATQDAAMINARLQAPRSLWDWTYNEGSWVNSVTGGPIALLPRLKSQISARYPGTKIAITEYYYGRGGDISGGIAQADVLGIFGREGVYAATFWPQAGIWASPYGGSGAKAYAYVFGAFRM
ncbi:MAG: Ig-like domain-containing protein, partial [Gemmatimonadaceae bacterium]|nr:Ig-like domain-containing protein [Gemmatimonadaceae bacterium]